jgi:hypothetical protein
MDAVRPALLELLPPPNSLLRGRNTFAVGDTGVTDSERDRIRRWRLYDTSGRLFLRNMNCGFEPLPHGQSGTAVVGDDETEILEVASHNLESILERLNVGKM